MKQALLFILSFISLTKVCLAQIPDFKDKMVFYIEKDKVELIIERIEVQKDKIYYNLPLINPYVAFVDKSVENYIFDTLIFYTKSWKLKLPNIVSQPFRIRDLKQSILTLAFNGQTSFECIQYEYYNGSMIKVLSNNKNCSTAIACQLTHSDCLVYFNDHVYDDCKLKQEAQRYK